MGRGEAAGSTDEASRRLLTVPNLLSGARIALIPVFVVLLLDPDTRVLGYALLVVVFSTDWVDGYIARRTGQVTELGKLLDPVADRLALAAALITFVVVDALPLWAALVVLVRDAVVLIVGTVLGARGIRIAVRPIGKYATFTLWWGVGLIAWSRFDFAMDDVAAVVGWVWFVVGVIEYYAATVAYAGDVREAVAGRSA
jgi:cardiolipin synthase (CMP-forming)